MCPEGKAFSIQGNYHAALLPLWISFPYYCLINQEARLFAPLAHPVLEHPPPISLAQPTQLLSPLTPPFSRAQHLPHTFIGTLYPLLPIPKEKKSYSFVNLKYSYNVITFHKDFQAALSAACHLSSLYHTGHLRLILYWSFHRSHPVSSTSFHVSGFNARALCCSKRGKELIFL